MSRVLQSLTKIKTDNAKHILVKVREIETNHSMPMPSSREKSHLKSGKFFGFNSIISSLYNVEKQFAVNAIKSKIEKGEKPSGFEHNPLNIIEAVK